MALLKFRVYPEDEFGVYRDVIIKHSQNFKELHEAILTAYAFDKKHQATFYRSNEDWKKGREISLEEYDKAYKVKPLLMEETKIGNEIFSINQKFIYEYDFAKNWVFYVDLIAVVKEEAKDKTYPYVSRTEGPGPQQYAKNNVLGEQFVDIEEKYDLNKDADGFSHDGDDGQDTDSEENFGDAELDD